MARDRLAIEALGPRGEYRTRRREVIADTQGTAVVDLSVVPQTLCHEINCSTAQDKSTTDCRPARRTDPRSRGLHRRGDRRPGLRRLRRTDVPDLRASVDGGRCRRAGRGRVTRDGSRRGTGCTSRRRDGRLARPAGGRGVGAPWRGARGPCTGQRARRARALAAGSRARVPRRGATVAARTPDRPPRGERLRQAGFRDADALYLPTSHQVADDSSCDRPTSRSCTAARTSPSDTKAIHGVGQRTGTTARS